MGSVQNQKGTQSPDYGRRRTIPKRSSYTSRLEDAGELQTHDHCRETNTTQPDVNFRSHLCLRQSQAGEQGQMMHCMLTVDIRPSLGCIERELTHSGRMVLSHELQQELQLGTYGASIAFLERLECDSCRVPQLRHSSRCVVRRTPTEVVEVLAQVFSVDKTKPAELADLFCTHTYEPRDSI